MSGVCHWLALVAGFLAVLFAAVVGPGWVFFILVGFALFALAIAEGFERLHHAREISDLERVAAEEFGLAPCPVDQDPPRPAEGRSLHRLRAAPDEPVFQSAASPERHQDDHALLKVYDGPSDRPGFNGWAYWVQCTRGCVSHDLPSRVDALAWIDLHADMENNLRAFGGVK